MSIGNTIYELRTAKKLSQGELAEILEVSRQSVSKWETDAAIPDLDKLIKLCDVFDVTLDELTGRVINKKAPPKTTNEKASQLTPQKIIGCVLLAISLIGFILLMLLSEDIEEQLITILILFSAFVCSLICLLVRQRAGYWCAWAAFYPINILTPYMVGLPIFSVFFVHMVFYAVMVFMANRNFSDISITIKRSRTAAVIAGWGAYVAIYVGAFLVHRALIPFAVVNLVSVNCMIYSAIALLLTYTVCYIRSARRNKSL